MEEVDSVAVDRCSVVRKFGGLLVLERGGRASSEAVKIASRCGASGTNTCRTGDLWARAKRARCANAHPRSLADLQHKLRHDQSANRVQREARGRLSFSVEPQREVARRRLELRRCRHRH